MVPPGGPEIRMLAPFGSQHEIILSRANNRVRKAPRVDRGRFKKKTIEREARFYIFLSPLSRFFWSEFPKCVRVVIFWLAQKVKFQKSIRFLDFFSKIKQKPQFFIGFLYFCTKSVHGGF